MLARGVLLGRTAAWASVPFEHQTRALNFLERDRDGAPLGLDRNAVVLTDAEQIAAQHLLADEALLRQRRLQLELRQLTCEATILVERVQRAIETRRADLEPIVRGADDVRHVERDR